MGYVLDFDEIDRTRIAAVGGKGANLGELSRIDGVPVPAGFCVTTDAYARVVEKAAIGDLLGELSQLAPEDLTAVAAVSARVRRAIEDTALPDDVAAAIRAAHARLGADAAYAVRSSATAEDLPTASFAGQQDTYLNVVGAERILAHVRRCLASLFTDRAVGYRMRNGFGHRRIRMGVVVQRMVFPQAAGVLVTADPLTGDRTVVSVDASFGLGEALVSGLVNADVYRVRHGAITDRAVATKKLAVEPLASGGTETREIDPERRNERVLTDEQVLRLAALGRRIEAHFGSPQDIEWCLDGADFRIVQSRPITTLFPIPEAADTENRVYVSVGHQQMMTDAMTPLGISVWQLTSRAPMRTAGGRLFVDVTAMLSTPSGRDQVVGALGKSDPLIGDALRTVLDRDGFVRTVPDPAAGAAPAAPAPAPLAADPDLVATLIADSEKSLATLRHDIETVTGPALLDFLRTDIQGEFRRVLFAPRSLQAITSGMDAAFWIDDILGAWLGVRNAADALTQSVPHNVTSEMGLALLDVADAIRPHPEVVAYLRRVEDTGDTAHFLDELADRPGGPAARAALETFLDRYGMRCAGEIDITRPRWSEEPATLVPTILGNIRHFAPGEAARRFEDGRRHALEQARDLVERVRGLPDGARKAEETERAIERIRVFTGYREYPKYGMVNRYFVYKQALLREAARLVAAGVVDDPQDIYYLTFDELDELVRTHERRDDLLRARKDEFRAYQALTPPRVLTSDGEMITGTYRRDGLPAGALPGMPVSAGVVEGRARVVTDLGQADLAPGDILVTAFTDPSWTPLFVAVAGLVTEVGGLMTHGAVIAREYGLPAVVGVERATSLIRDGQRIRVHGSDGYIEVLS
ncbi:phosphoenolpyruvate synthase [Nocardia asteroides NBRC 15531]|uniref:Rifampicin phosphotransferase n=1 Tax=Nocardia asteroides NBRC 15531 TaxID=1110697 RepID=U5E7G4_NOCAS|nr:rifamycin-inactivating phosphotransferase [Nocardia asteroides]TLF66622.1 phosphoenolpyruvate synthase [Nocardia asteroides NBRC 15531]UGT46277.1 phosphoenolpyruvate synthase [Nocardia asteroides]SFM96413.1 pyruvate, water dikinase [Nocardia asteroides]VEG34922.1 Phosphoenolpyruvate synthase [Nocardia asteroides]GAD82353.1 phosphoenolpyruvate synthase [Nocardia asteroides NBRC 15531]